MPILIKKLNFRNIHLEQDTRETVGVLLKSSQVRYVSWNGFIELEQARRIHGAKPVKLVISAYIQGDDISCARIDLSRGQYVQGCLLGNAVYGVVENGSPRIVGGEE